MRNNICAREEKQCPQGQGKAVSTYSFVQLSPPKQHLHLLHILQMLNLSAHRALLSRGTYVRMARSPVVQTEIETRARSTLGNVLTGTT